MSDDMLNVITHGFEGNIARK